jgi:large subunit ribosomal protein L31
MKTSIHPDYVQAHVRCTCGNEFTTRATRAELHVEVCSNCHPFYTGRQKLVDTGGRVERFQRRMAKGRLRQTHPEGHRQAGSAQPAGAQTAPGPLAAGGSQSQTQPE